MVDVAETPRARQLVSEELCRAPSPPGPGSTAACVSLPASESVILPAPPPSMGVSQRLLEDWSRVCSVQAAGRLEGVPIHASADQYVSLLPMARQLHWRIVQVANAVGLDGRLSDREVVELSGNRGRLR